MELVLLNGATQKRLDYFDKFSLTLRYDAVASSFGFEFYFNPANPDHERAVRVGDYQKCRVTHNGETLVTGTILSPAFKYATVRQLVTLSGYTLTGVLEDCEIPTSLYPLQSDGLSLRQIATKLLRPFGLSMVVDSAVSKDMDSVLATSTAKDTQAVRAYLSELAAQKNIVLSHTAAGELLFTRANTKQAPVLELDATQGAKPATSYALSFNGQGMHSHITVIKQADSDGGNAGESTVTNPYVRNGVFRPKVMTQTSGDDNDTLKAAKTARAAELKGLALTITINKWDPNGVIIRPNSIITVTNPEIFVKTKTRWFVEEVSYTGDASATTATLKCVLPCVYDGSEPVYIF